MKHILLFLIAIPFSLFSQKESSYKSSAGEFTVQTTENEIAQSFTPVKETVSKTSDGGTSTLIVFQEEKTIIEPKEEIGISVYPNPSKGIFEIQLPVKNCGVEIVSVLGEKIFSSTTSNKLTSVNLSAQPKGIYFLKVANGDKIYTQKIIIQ